MTEIESTILSDIAESLAIPEDGVLSRVLFRDDDIRVVGFAFDTGQELTEHTAALPVIIQVLSGRFRFTAGDETSEIGSESWIHLEASAPHSLVALEPSRLLLTLLS
ncbi:MAG: cupin [Actinobacteria bacterium]|nr:MAG: cupin [Actinomycetota bacterium]